jgi:hypothetical protein
MGYNAPTLAVLTHQGARSKKVTTKHSKVTPSATVATLVEAFKVTTRFILMHADVKSY